MNIEREFLNLLYWIREIGLTPKKVSRHDRFLNPFTNKVAPNHRLSENQRRHSLWVPTLDGIRRILPRLKHEICGHMHIITDERGYVGAGPGETEALLSLLNNVRTALPC
jgi:hypothetical protein